MYGRPILCDFGEARSGSSKFHEDIQPYLYRAPEVLLRMVWDRKVDIWNIGVLVWDLFESRHLFTAEDGNGQNSNVHHLAEMVALLGPPPTEFLQRSDYASEFFDDDGNWEGGIEIPPMSLEDFEKNLHGSSKVPFLQFMRKMLQWAPEARPSAKELLSDPWLTAS
ncbi:kinase-like domain-containing protein [Lipomyces mesembrius]